MNISITIEFYTDNKLDKKYKTTGFINKEKKIIDFNINNENIIINYKNNPIIKKEDEEKKIIITKDRIKVFIKDMKNDIILPTENYKYIIDKKSIEINYNIKDSNEEKRIKLIYREE